MNETQIKIARQSADDRLISYLLPGNKSLELEERFRKKLLDGDLDERRLEVFDSHERKKTMSVREVRELLYKEECTKLTNRSAE